MGLGDRLTTLFQTDHKVSAGSGQMMARAAFERFAQSVTGMPGCNPGHHLAPQPPLAQAKDVALLTMRYQMRHRTMPACGGIAIQMLADRIRDHAIRPVHLRPRRCPGQELKPIADVAIDDILPD